MIPDDRPGLVTVFHANSFSVGLTELPALMHRQGITAAHQAPSISFAASVRIHVVSRPNVIAWLSRSFTTTFVGLGSKLTFAARQEVAGPFRSLGRSANAD
jgi:hypothetical protein